MTKNTRISHDVSGQSVWLWTPPPAGLASAAGLHCKRACQTMTITVEHHSDGLTTSFPCHFQRFHGEPAVRRERHGPAHWFSCEQVENNGEVRPALIRPDIGHITAPHLIWPGHGELLGMPKVLTPPSGFGISIRRIARGW